MSLPKYVPTFRSKKIKYFLLPYKRDFTISKNRFIKTDFLKVQNTFMFWILLMVFAQIGIICFLALANTHGYVGLKVTLPKAENTIDVSRDDNTIHIWIDRNSEIIINDSALL